MENWHLLTPLCFTWVGFISAISFMESWLKFKAPGITLPIGLSIGRLVFNTLNKIEWFFAFLSILFFGFGNISFNKGALLLTFSICILLAQTIWLLPVMNARASLRIQGNVIAKSYLHIYYVGMEVIKVGCLIALGLTAIN